MPKFEIAWTFGGYTTIEAKTDDEARDKFYAMDHSEIIQNLIPLDDTLDVCGIEEVGY